MLASLNSNSVNSGRAVRWSPGAVAIFWTARAKNPTKAVALVLGVSSAIMKSTSSSAPCCSSIQSHELTLPSQQRRNSIDLGKTFDDSGNTVEEDRS
jgi:hypothetical protein